MKKISFFKSTLVNKEFIILDSIEKNPKITQRKLANLIGSAVSMVNHYIDIFNSRGLLNKMKYSKKNVEYIITKKGIDRKKVLNISYLNDSLQIYNSAKLNIVEFLNQVIEKGFNNILLYGAGEVAEILLQTIILDNEIPIKVLGVVDDNINKQDKYLINTKIISIHEIKNIKHDGILISSYTNSEEINKKLVKIKYDRKKILHFFD